MSAEPLDPPAHWPVPPAWPALAHGAVHVWRASLRRPAAALRALAQTLAPDERARAERFHSPHDGARFVAGRGLLRALLGRYLACEPGAIEFAYNPYGKPALAGSHGDTAIHFNLAHSGDLALYAFAIGSAVGVDLEYLRADVDALELAERFFSPHERTTLRALPEAARSQAFFAGWARKEAYVKARGAGLALPLDQFSVSLAPGAPAELLDVAGDAHERARWALWALDPRPGYAAALAVAGRGHSVHCWEYVETSG